jgi:glutamate-5-semialdehyde dehydrogenase
MSHAVPSASTPTQEAALEREIRRVASDAREAAKRLAVAATEDKNAALRAMADELRRQQEAIRAANAADVQDATAQGLGGALVDRLTLTERRLEEMIQSVEAVVELADPVGQILRDWQRPNGLQIRKVRVPLGVIGIIYESRPDVTSECGSLCVKSGNAVVLRGGSEAFRSNQAIAAALRRGLARAGLPEAAISLIPTTDRAGVALMLRLEGLIDVVIPRGGEALIRTVVETSRIPVIKHAKGVCHVYVDEAADLDMAEAIALNAKCQRPATCNAMETLLVHERIAPTFLPRALARLTAAGVEIRGCERTRTLAPGAAPATEADWSTEYLDLILSVKVVPSLEEAVAHISRYGSAHSDAIVTRDPERARRFTQAVDSAAVYVNASTRFTDGFQFGLGAEIGISTDRLHARGPMGLEELTTYKYVVHGSGQIRH